MTISERNLMFEKKNITKYEFGGPFKRVKTCPNGPKVIFLLIKTYFLEYLCSERFPAARHCACFIFLYIEFLFIYPLPVTRFLRQGDMLFLAVSAHFEAFFKENCV